MFINQIGSVSKKYNQRVFPQKSKKQSKTLNNDYNNNTQSDFFSIPVDYYSISKISNVSKQFDFSDALDIALLRANVGIENAKENNVPKEELKNMELAKNILEIARIGIENKNYKNNKISFSSSNIDYKEKRMKENKELIHGSAAMAAFAALACGKIPGSDEVLLTGITMGMAAKLCSKYENATFDALAPTFARIAGKALGESILNYLVKWVSGPGVNAVITFSLHEATGWAIVAALEKLEETGEINEDVSQYIKSGKELKAKFNND